jgi:methyltransferase (TIGR00027 family)
VGRDDQWDVGSGVGITALAVALARTRETHRRDGLVHDPYAERFIAAANLPEPYASWPSAEALSKVDVGSWWDSMPTYVGVRSRFFDEYFAAAGAAGIRQVVLVAAGLDTRAYRLPWPSGTRLFEVDQPLVLGFKDEILTGHSAQPACARHPVAADLRDDWGAALRGRGFDPTWPTAWQAEGLLSFLTPQVEHDMFAAIRALSAPGSWLAIESVPGNARYRAVNSPVASAWEHNVGIDVSSVWQTEPRPEPIDVLTAGGWRVCVERVADAAERFGRPVHGIMNIAAQHSTLLTATR